MTTQTIDATQSQEPRLVRVDIAQDAGVTITGSDWRQGQYAQWTTNDEGRRVLRIEPLTLDQVAALEDAIGNARRRYAAGLVDRARDAATAGGAR